MHETEKIERKKNLKKRMSLRNCSNHLLFLMLFSQTLLFWIEKKLIVLVITLSLDIIFEKRAANFIRRYKIAYFYVKIGLWILTTKVTKIAFIKVKNQTYLLRREDYEYNY